MHQKLFIPLNGLLQRAGVHVFRKTVVVDPEFKQKMSNLQVNQIDFVTATKISCWVGNLTFAYLNPSL